MEFTVRTKNRSELVKITREIQSYITESGVRDGLCVIFVPHTTAGVTINEGADPDVVRDIIMELDKRIPWEDGYLHGEGNSAAHIKASMMGSSETIIIENRTLKLGTWQQIYFCEFDGPRTRTVWLKIMEL
jgi:secondary thiamine-phosphate synthase enzyme